MVYRHPQGILFLISEDVSDYCRGAAAEGAIATCSQQGNRILIKHAHLKYT